MTFNSNGGSASGVGGDWNMEKTITVGQSVAKITSRPGARGGKLFSIMFGRAGRTPEDKTSPFFRPDDMKDMPALVSQVDAWLAEHKDAPASFNSPRTENFVPVDDYGGEHSRKDNGRKRFERQDKRRNTYEE